MGIVISTLLRWFKWTGQGYQGYQRGTAKNHGADLDLDLDLDGRPRNPDFDQGLTLMRDSTFPLLDIFLAQVGEKMDIADFLFQLNDCDSHAEQIQLVKYFFHGTPESGLRLRQIYGKSSGVCSEYCDNVESALSQNYLKVAEQNSTLAFAYAETEEDLAAAHTSRASLLFVYKDYSGALTEIGQSTAILSRSCVNVNANSRGLMQDNVKLRAKIEAEIRRDKTRKDKSVKVEQSSREEKKKRKKFGSELFRLKSPNPKSPAIEDFVKIQVNKERGRHLVVTKEVPIGTTLLVEKPFVLGLNGTLEMDSSHCHHCLKSTATNNCIPCPGCTFALFCDEKCLTTALATYHKFECLCLPHIRGVLTNQKEFDGVNFHLAFKLILTVGPQKLFRLFKQHQKQLQLAMKQESNITPHPEKTDDPENSDFFAQSPDFDRSPIFNCPTIDPTTQVYSSSSYLCILHLNSVFKSQCQISRQSGSGSGKSEKSGKCPDSTLSGKIRRPEPALPLVALILSRILDANTDFFHNIDIDSDDESQGHDLDLDPDLDLDEGQSGESEADDENDSGVDESSPCKSPPLLPGKNRKPEKTRKNRNTRESSSKTEFQDFIAQLILHHFHCIRNNVFSIWEMEFPLDHEFVSWKENSDPNPNFGGNSDSDSDPSEEIDPGRLEYEMNLYGRGLYGTASLLNHSCDPNVMMYHNPLDCGEIAIATIKALKPGEELLIFYCPPFSDQPKDERRRRLERIYNFPCFCVACANDWPMNRKHGHQNESSKNYQNPPRKINFVCPKCCAKLANEEKSRDKMRGIRVTAKNGFKCPTCKEQYRQRDFLDKFERHKRVLYKSLRQINSNCPLPALGGIKNAMDFFQHNVEPPFELQSLVQKFLITAIQLILHFSK